MAETSVTYVFTAGAEGWTGYPETGDSSVQRYQDITTEWCFQHRIYGRNKGPDLNYAEISDTWLNLFSALKSGDVITGVRFGGWDDSCEEYNVVAEARFSNQTGANANAVEYRGSSNIELYAGTNVTGTYAWTGRSGAGSYESVPVGDQSADNTVAFRVNTFQENANNVAAVSALLWDDLVIEIQYQAGRIPRSASMCPILGG